MYSVRSAMDTNDGVHLSVQKAMQDVHVMYVNKEGHMRAGETDVGELG